MIPPAKSTRFRVALSFPGEHRPRVEKIAEALADHLTRERILYDKWYAAEFNRPRLDIYLSDLYHNNSDLIAVFLCKEYNEKEWTGLEWDAIRDLLKRKADERLMFFRLDDAEIAGFLSIHGYQDIRTMSDADVAAAILKRLGEDRPGGLSHRAFTSKFPLVNPTLIGRDPQLDFLNRAWADPATNFVQIIAAGGTGKTALVDSGSVATWARLMSSAGPSIARAVPPTARLPPTPSSPTYSVGWTSTSHPPPPSTPRPTPSRSACARSACC